MPKTLFINYRITQLFLFPFQHLGLAHIFFALLSFVPFSCTVEEKKGTSRFLASFFCWNFIIALVCDIFFALFALVWKSRAMIMWAYPVGGLWPITMVYMVQVLAESEAYTDFLFLPVQVKAKWYPVWFFFTWVLLVGYVWDLGIGMAVGYISIS